jgi:apolipoprotein N-acyltransferase
VRRRTAAERALSARRALALGLLAGGVYFSVTLYWLVETMTTFGGLATPLAVIAAGILVAYLALFPAAFAVMVVRFVRALGPIGLLLASPAWVTGELGRQYVWDGFPWELLGYSQVTSLPIAQLASVVGVYGLSALLVLSASAAALLIVDRNPRGRVRRFAPAVCTLVFLLGATAWGSRRLAASTMASVGEPVRVAVLQGNVEQVQKWDPRLVDDISGRYLAMTREALAGGAKFILWPESSTPYLFERDLVRGGAVRRLAREGQVTLLIGSDQVEPIKPAAPGEKPQYRYYNAAFLVKPDGSVGGVYRKMHLVPFGEYVPLKRLLFFVGPIVEAVSDFSPGADPVLLPVGSHEASTAICYEVIYGNMIRNSVQQGSELLTTITNDAWYGRSSAAYQHWDQASMRAIENGRYLARAANTGISGFVDPYGRILDRSQLFEQKLLIQDLRFLSGRTIYSRIGDLVAWLSLALVAAALLAAGRMNV